MKNLSLLLFLFLICLSCSSDNPQIDSSAIASYYWKLTAFKTSQPIDLNHDGIASTDMTLEFDCISEAIRFNLAGDGTFYFYTEPIAVNVNPDNSISNYFCGAESNLGMQSGGTYKMLTKNTIQLYYKETYLPFGEFTPYKLKYDLVGDKLIQTSEQTYPTTYDILNTRWINSSITVTREYEKAPFPSKTISRF